jgi:hypothetical protein
MRSLKDKSYYSKDSEKLHLWVHLLLTANWNDREEMLGGKPIICKAGQFTTGRKQLSKETGISESKIERLLTYFEKTEQQIEQRKTNTNRLISILNWDKYQVIEQPTKQRVNNNRTTSEQRVNTLKEYKEDEEIKEEEEEIKQTILSFDEFWDLYGKKVGKTKAQDLFEKTTEAERKLIKEFIPKYKISKPEVKYRKDPERFLKYKVWEDEIISTEPEDKTGMFFINGEWRKKTPMQKYQ